VDADRVCSAPIRHLMAEAPAPVLEPAAAQASTTPPSPLFSPEQLESHAAALARAHTISADPRLAAPLLPRLEEGSKRLEAAYQFLSGIALTYPQPVAS
jgi:hypothetical protein